MSTYNTTYDIWRSLGTDTYTLVRDEYCVGDGVSTAFTLSGSNLISGSETVSSSEVLAYSMDLENGIVTFSTAPSASSEIRLNYATADMADSKAQDFLNQADEELEAVTGRTYALTTTSEYMDVEKGQTVFFTKQYPIVSLTCSENLAAVVDTPDWTERTEGIGNDYLMDDHDKLVGTFEFIDNYPVSGKKRLKVDYVYGYSTIPEMVKDLHALLTIRKMINSTLYKAIFKGRDEFSPARLVEIEAQIQNLTKMLRKDSISRI